MQKPDILQSKFHQKTDVWHQKTDVFQSNFNKEELRDRHKEAVPGRRKFLKFFDFFFLKHAKGLPLKRGMHAESNFKTPRAEE